jgi:acetylornithine deacetylase/succinyl-diaminopimelate desuccinylase family protein
MLSNVTQILQSLVRIPSVNPDGDPGTDQTGELACAEWVGGFLRRLGAEVTFDEVLPGRPNVIGRFAASAGKPKVLLAPHLDTVSVGGMTIDPFAAEIRDGRLWGRGASDTKGTAAAMLAALERIKEQLPTLGAEITFVGLMGEESSQYGSKHFAKHHPEFDFALVGEPTECKVVHTHKGSLWADLITHGKAVHGATPERGENAILKMLPILQRLSTEFVQQLRDPAFHHAVLGNSTVNFGVIRGGARKNIVADRCEASLDIRYTPRLHERGVMAFLTHFLKGEDVEIRSFVECAPLDTDPLNPYVVKLAAAGHGLTGAPWFCDAAWLAAAGIPSVAAGPGSIAQAHTCDEYISLQALEDGVDFYQRFLERL